MQKKINYNEIYCLVKNYDSIFKNLKGLSDIFAERFTRGNMLVWDCQGEGWQSLDKADVDIVQKVATQLETHKQSIKGKFGEQESHTVDKIFQTPGDNCIFYKIDQNGNLKIKLTAWGYTLPTRSKGSDATGKYNPPPKPPIVELPTSEKQPKEEEAVDVSQQPVMQQSEPSAQPTVTETPKEQPIDNIKTEKQEQTIQEEEQPTTRETTTIDENKQEEHPQTEKENKEVEEREIKSTIVVIKEENSSDFSWKNFLIVLGLIAMTAGTYYVCSQII